MVTIIAISNVKCQIWQVKLLFESFREHNFKYPVHLLIYKVNETEEWLEEWDILEKDYPEVQIFRYSDNGSLDIQLKSYHNLHRFYSLREHFKANPQLEKEAILYFDSDIILTKEMNLDDIIGDDINYGADINSYNNHSYFVDKRCRVRPERLEEWDTMKPLNNVWGGFGLKEETIKSFNEDTAGVPFLLKNITWQFWDECLTRTVPLKKTFDSMNAWFISGNTPQQKSDNGWQSFCSDMWCPLWLLWARGDKTKIDSRLNFSWATSNIENVEETGHIHMAGYYPQIGWKGFWKGKYIDGSKSPFDDSEQEYLLDIVNDPENKKYANHVYTKYILKIKNKNHG